MINFDFATRFLAKATHGSVIRSGLTNTHALVSLHNMIQERYESLLLGRQIIMYTISYIATNFDV